MKYIKTLILALLLTPFAFAQNSALTDAQISMAKLAIQGKLKDPESAQFSRIQPSLDGQFICGFVNAKNSYGGYSGVKQFVVSLPDGEFADIGKDLLPDDVNPKLYNEEIALKCKLTKEQQRENMERIISLSNEIKKSISKISKNKGEIQFSGLYAISRKGSTICGEISEFIYEKPGFFSASMVSLKNAKFEASQFDSGKLYLRIQGLDRNSSVFKDEVAIMPYDDNLQCQGKFSDLP